MSKVAQQPVDVFKGIPPLLRNILLNDAATQATIEITDELGLNPAQIRKFMSIYRKVVLKQIVLAQLNSQLQTELGIDADKSKSVVVSMLGKCFLPMQWYLGNVEELIKQLGGDLAKYQAEAEKNYPEVYHPELAEKAKEPEVAEETPEESTEPTILRNIEDRLTTPKGRAEVLLRLTALSQEIEDAAKANKLSEKEGQELMHSLDALSYAVNTQDLNPLETAAIKRRLKNVIAKLKSASA